MKLKTLEMTFSSTREFKENILCTRGFFATKFTEYVQLHNHITDKFVYSYPTIQYKVIKNRPLILGINEGIGVLKEIFDDFDKVRVQFNLFLQQTIEKIFNPDESLRMTEHLKKCGFCPFARLCQR